MDEENLFDSGFENDEPEQTEQENTEQPGETGKPEKPERREKREKPEQKRRGRTLRRILAGLLTLLLVAAAVLAFVYRDRLTGENLRRLFGRETSEIAAREAFTYETGAEQIFAAAGNGLAASPNGSANTSR